MGIDRPTIVTIIRMERDSSHLEWTKERKLGCYRRGPTQKDRSMMKS
jgi:hypothetical protein